jgi:hypothetical protein
MSERDIQYESFKCTKMGTIVNIIKTILTPSSSHTPTGDIDSQYTIGWDCDHKSDCGVGKLSGQITTYDWSKCVYPGSKLGH